MTVKELISKLRKDLKEESNLQVGVKMEDGSIAVITDILGIFTISPVENRMVILDTDTK